MSKLKRIIGIILIVIGVVIVVTIAYRKIMTYKNQQDMLDAYDDAIENADEDADDSSNTIEVDGYTAVAKIEIPSIDLEQVVVEGVGSDVLRYYLGHFEETAEPGQVGNFAVAGHRVSSYADVFENLSSIEIGAEVIVTTTDAVYTYVVEETYVVDPDQTEVLDSTEDATITLITCTTDSKHRFVVKGTLQSTEEL